MRYRRLLLISVLAALMTVEAHSQIGLGKPFFRNFRATEYKGHNRNFDIECDDKGRVFVANFEGLLVYDGVQWINHHTPGISRITALYKSSDGVVWFGGNNVFGYVEGSDSVTLNYIVHDLSDSLSIGEVSRIYAKGKEIQLCTSNGQLFSVSGQRLRCIGSYQETVQPRYFNGMEVTDEVSITGRDFSVLGTVAYGIIAKNAQGSVLNMMTTDDGLCSNSIKALAYDGKGTMWGATDNGIFAICESTVFAHYGESDGLQGQVTSILDSHGRVYVGTLQGLFVLSDAGKFSRVQEIDLACWQLVAQDDGKILAATATGVFEIEPSVRQIIANHTLSLYAESSGQFLAGTLDGIILHKTDGTNVTIDRITNVMKFRMDGKGNLWAVDINNTTYCRQKAIGHFARCKSKDLSVLFDFTDDKGHTWKTALNGMGLVSSALTDKQTRWCRPLSEYSIQAMDINEDGIAWIGGNFGLIRMNLSAMNTMDTYKPNVYVRSVRKGLSDIHITTSSDKHDPIGKTVYSFRLHDDEAWSQWTTDQTLDFNNLAPGSYQIAVRMSDPFGNTSVSSPVLFSVPIPFFFRWYMLLLYLTLFICLAYLFFRWRTYRTQQENERLEKVVEERTQDLKNAQEQLIRQEREATVGKLTKGLIDRILNPMNYINNFSHLSLGLAKDLTENLQDDEEKMTPDTYEDSMDVIGMLKTNLEKIEQHGLSTTRILKAMEELLKDRSRKSEPTNVVSLCEQTLDVFRKYKVEIIDEISLKTETKFAVPELLSTICAQNMSRAILSVLSNSLYAVKKKAEKAQDGLYTPTIKISVNERRGDEPASIVIFDNGIGIESNILNKVFDPFFTTKPTSEAPGVGLYFTQQVIQDVGGSISITSEKDNYTEVTIKLPK